MTNQIFSIRSVGLTGLLMKLHTTHSTSSMYTLVATASGMLCNSGAALIICIGVGMNFKVGVLPL